MLFASLLILQSNLFALSYLKNDFRDTNNSLNITALFNAKSDNLSFNIFDNDAVDIATKTESIDAFARNYYDVYIDFDGFKFGVFKEELAQADVNDGLNETWNRANKDFLTLLLNKDVNQEREPKSIKGNLTHYDTYGIYLQKAFQLNKSNFLSLKVKLNYAKGINHLEIEGNSDGEDFVTSFDYFYSTENFITEGDIESREGVGLGLGYGIDVEYIYNKNQLYLYAGAFNIASYIYWDNLTLMHYDLNSEVIYRGEDGYNHYRPFGVGTYQYNVKFTQKLPQYYKLAFNYEVDSFSYGNSSEIYDNIYFNELYATYRYKSGRYKVGYIVQSSTFVFATYFKYFMIEASNYFSRDKNIFQANCKISF